MRNTSNTHNACADNWNFEIINHKESDHIWTESNQTTSIIILSFHSDVVISSIHSITCSIVHCFYSFLFILYWLNLKYYFYLYEHISFSCKLRQWKWKKINKWRTISIENIFNTFKNIISRYFSSNKIINNDSIANYSISYFIFSFRHIRCIIFQWIKCDEIFELIQIIKWESWNEECDTD